MDEHVTIKNLLLCDKTGRTVLVIMKGDKRLDLKKMAEKVESGKLIFASREKLKELFEVEPGAVSLFGLVQKNAKCVEVVLDQEILNLGEIGFHPNDNTKSIFLAAKNVPKILDHLGNKYCLVDL